jgi:hypothetical protein
LSTVALSPSLSGSSLVNVYDGASMFQSSTSYINRGIINIKIIRLKIINLQYIQL